MTFTRLLLTGQSGGEDREGARYRGRGGKQRVHAGSFCFSQVPPNPRRGELVRHRPRRLLKATRENFHPDGIFRPTTRLPSSPLAPVPPSHFQTNVYVTGWTARPTSCRQL